MGQKLAQVLSEFQSKVLADPVRFDKSSMVGSEPLKEYFLLPDASGCFRMLPGGQREVAECGAKTG